MEREEERETGMGRGKEGGKKGRRREGGRERRKGGRREGY